MPIPFVTLSVRRLGPVLSVAGFVSRAIPEGSGFDGRPSTILHHWAGDDRLIAVMEWHEARHNGTALRTELMALPSERYLTIVETGPVAWLHSAVFRMAFPQSVPAPVICAAAIASQTVTVQR